MQLLYSESAIRPRYRRMAQGEAENDFIRATLHIIA